MTKKLCAVLLGLMGAVSPCCAQTPCANWPVKVNCKVQFDVKFGPLNNNGCQQNKTPWYLYFPYDPCKDPNAVVEQPGNRYPNWPHTIPCESPVPPKASLSNYPTWPTQTGNSQPPSANPNIILTSSSSANIPYWPAATWQQRPYAAAPPMPTPQRPAYWYGW